MDALRLNRLLENRVRELAERKPARNRIEHQDRTRTDRGELLKSLGLEPLPPRTDLLASVTGVVQREGYRIEKLAYFSRPGVRVTAHLYLPEGIGPFPIVLCPHGHWHHKKSEPVVQAQGIGLALEGFIALVVDSPGHSWDDHERNERRALGTHDDPMLSMGMPVQGLYVWDLMRGLDYLEGRKEADSTKVGIAGASGGGTASLLAFAADARIGCCVPICYATSLETNPHNGCLCNHLPGLVQIGDRSDWLALRAPNPILLIGAAEDDEFPRKGHERTLEKLKAIYRHFGAEDRVRLEVFEGGHDMNRRMREAALAFFDEHLREGPRRRYLAERRPLTDGALNSYPANTEPPESEELLVLSPSERSTTTFRELLFRSLAEPYPSAFETTDRMVPWSRYGKLPQATSSTTLVLSDSLREGAIVLPIQEVDQRLCLYLGISVPEFLAQVLHQALPGGPEGWEESAVVGDVVTSMIASMKTLVGQGQEPVPTEVVADGVVAEMVARHLVLLRPELKNQSRGNANSWLDLLEIGHPKLAMPQARYLQWPY